MIAWIRDLGPIGRQAALLLLACALLVRLAVPAGWMPDASSHGFALTICSGTVDPLPAPQITSVLKAALEQQQPTPDTTHKVPCDFASLVHGATLTAPGGAIAPPIAPAVASVRPARFWSTPGRGLAAPPPPPTGPPSTLA